MKKVKRILIGIVILTLFSCILFFYLYFYWNRPWHRALFMEPIYQLNTSEKVIALTFDDGPSSTRTPALLDLLKRYEVRVTFFLQGNKIEAYPEIARRIINEGHLVGNHAYDHRRLYLKTPQFIRQQIEKTDSLILSLGAHQVDYFRPPYCAKMIVLPLVLRSMHKKLVTCNYDPMLQYQKNFNADKVARQVIENARPGRIIPLHDGRHDHAEEFVTAVEQMIVELKKEGYRFVTLDEAF